jgi:Skp family chaperone for outer membrane proteins
VNTEAFGDEKAGISRYVAALKSVEREFQPRQEGLLAMQARITSINNEVTKLNADRATAATIQSKMDESQRLQIELKRQSEDAQAAFTKRTDEVMNPIMQDIGRSLEQFATQRNITLLLDISKMAPAILSLNPASDLTTAFIAEYNKKNPAPPAP